MTMPEQKVSLSWQGSPIDLPLAPEWQVKGILQPSAGSIVADTRQETVRSLASPMGSPRLKELAKPGQKITLVIDDASRPTPVSEILPAVLDELTQSGIDLSQVTLVAALGVHRAMTPDELAARVGPGVLERLNPVTHDCDDPAKLKRLGITSRGTPVDIQKNVAESDLVILIGCIEPHIIASFGGGYKNLIPGVAGRATIAHNHSLNCRPQTFNMVGQPIQQNPMRLDLEEGCQMLPGKVFIINAVINSSLQVVQIVSGDPIQAHRAGAQISAQIYGAPVPGLVDIVITASHPMDQDLRQGVKALANTIRAVKPGGVVITLVEANEGLGVFGLANRKLPVGKKTLKALAPILLPFIPKIKLTGMGEEDRFFLYFALQAMRRCKIYMVAPTIPTAVHENLPFVDFVPDVTAALQAARQRFPHQASVLAFPMGGITYPILPS
jgi:lactate racemase